MLPPQQLSMLALSDHLESEALALPQVPCPVVHHFGPGVYMREIQLAADTFVVGRNHRQPHLNIMLKGTLQLVDDDGSTRTLTAPQMYTSQGGRKCALVLDDVVWLNVLATDLVDVEAIESWMFDDGAVAVDHYARTFEHHRSLRQAERDDFAACGQEWPAIPVVAADTASTLVVRTSPIEGRGVFSSTGASEGETLALVALPDGVTAMGAMVNHSHNPNAHFALDANGAICLVARRRIAGCVGGDHGEEITVDYRQAVPMMRGLACLV
jgi:hypothetical protein